MEKEFNDALSSNVQLDSGKNDQDDSCSVPPNSARSDRGHDSKSALLKADISGEIVTMLHHCCRSPASPPPGNMENQRRGMSN